MHGCPEQTIILSGVSEQSWGSGGTGNAFSGVVSVEMSTKADQGWSTGQTKPGLQEHVTTAQLVSQRPRPGRDQQQRPRLVKGRKQNHMPHSHRVETSPEPNVGSGQQGDPTGRRGGPKSSSEMAALGLGLLEVCASTGTALEGGLLSVAWCSGWVHFRVYQFPS